MSVRVNPGNVLVVKLDPQEDTVLRMMLDMMCRVCNDRAFGPALRPPSPGDDPLTLLERSWDADQDYGAVPADPAARRLFPDACPTDQAVSADFRRLTLDDQRLGKLVDAAVVREGLDHADMRGQVHIGPPQHQAWMSTLASIRLVLAARLGIVSDEDEDRFDCLDDEDPAYWLYNVYLWLAWVQESLVDCLMRGKG